MPTRRSVLKTTAALTLAGAGALAGAGPVLAGGGKPRSRALVLPEPTGPHPVGTTVLRLVDRGRPDPWKPGQPYRELMVTVRYPAAPTTGGAVAPQLAPGEAAGFARFNNMSGVPGDAADWAATRSHAHPGAPAAPLGPRPVIFYSPGLGDPRGLGTTLYDDLASRGFVTVAVDHTYDATAVEFPGGRVESTVLPDLVGQAGDDPEAMRELLRTIAAVRVADLRFVLDALPGALPRAPRALADFGRLGAYGQSAGGFIALQAMHDDPRLAAGADLDGVLAFVQDDSDPGHLSSVAADGLDRPFLILGKDGNDASTVPSWQALRAHSPGVRNRITSLPGAAHATYTDLVAMLPQLGLAADVLKENTGTIDPHDAVHRQRSLLAGFFTEALG
ncbi:hydrolase [Streptomyces sp. NPDC050560]|uniref:alpha/beta hydrolase n=1 Tax=Streptomyces sp. NPDC050560 TaxID=3365630 RepID=UPI0037BD1242